MVGGGKVGVTGGSVTTAVAVAGAVAMAGAGVGAGVGAKVEVAAGVTVGAAVAAALVATGDGSIVESCVGSWALDAHATGPNKANASRLTRKILLVATDGLRGLCFGPLIENDYRP